MRVTIIIAGAFAALVSACDTPRSAPPSLAHRPAEEIDPRLPVVHSAIPAPADPELAARLADLVGQARSGHSDFISAAATASRLADDAGAAQSESWIAAQQALSAAVAARRPVAQALADVDSLAALRIQRQGRIGDLDFEAIRRAVSEISAIDRQETETLEAIQRRLAI